MSSSLLYDRFHPIHVFQVVLPSTYPYLVLPKQGTSSYILEILGLYMTFSKAAYDKAERIEIGGPKRL